MMRGETDAREGVGEQNQPMDSGKTCRSSHAGVEEEEREARSAERPQILSHADHKFYYQRLEEYASQQHSSLFSGTWGPEEADALIEKDGRQWDNP